LDDEYITGTIRITLSEYITKSNILTAFEAIKKYVEVLRCIENN
jgi:cysteine sulfinate desulfinase/cysteine desulfurase-like protein